MRIRKASAKLLIAASVAGAAGVASAAYLTPTIDGQGITTGNNGPSLAVQTATAGFDATLQMGELRVANDGTNLYVSIPGNNNNGGSGIYLFIDSVSGGVSEVATNPSPGYGEFDVLGATGGANMPASFLADFALNLQSSGDGGHLGTWNLLTNTATYRGATGSYTGGFNVAQDNSNATAVPWATGAVTTGVEMVIPLSAIGSPATGSTIKLFAVAGNRFGGGPDNTVYLSNQILPNSGTPGNFGRNGSGGDGVGTSFNGTGGPNVTPASYSIAFGGFTGAGTYTVGPGGNYASLAAFLDDACKVRELTGVISSSGTTINGTGTSFTTEVAVGDRILTSTGSFRGTAQILTVASIVSDTQLTVSVAPSAAITSLKATRQRASGFPTTLTGNVTALITGDITETVNSMVILNTAGFTFTIKPAPSTTPTITFARAEDQTGFTGNLIIGTNNVGANAVIAATDNIVIDGSNTVGGTTRDLTITSNMTYSASVPVHVTGDADNVVIKNARIINNGSNTGANVSALRFSAVQYAVGTTDFSAGGYAAGGASGYYPDNITIDNNELVVINGSQGHGINLTNTVTTAPANTAMTNVTITNNDISARLRGVFMNPVSTATITGNRMAIGLGGSTNGITTFGIFNNTSNGAVATQTISGNVVEVISDNNAGPNGPVGMQMGTYGAGSTINITNNTIRVVNNGLATRPGFARGLILSSGVNYNTRHNTIDISYTNTPAAGTVSPAAVYGIGNFLGSANQVIQNNIISVRVPGGAAYWRPNSPSGTFTLADNLINVPSGVIGTNFRSIATAGSPTRASSGTTRTLFFGTTTHGLAVGDTIMVFLNTTAANAAQYDGTFTVATVPTTTSITYTGATSLTETAASTTFTVLTNNGSSLSYANLAAWQGSTSTPDLTSTAADITGTVSLTDLHLIATPSANFTAAAQVGSITTDVDGQTRAATPNRGADEFTANSAPTAVSGTPVASVAENAGTAVLINNAFGTDPDVNDFPVVTATSSAGTVSVTRLSTRQYRVNLASALDFETNPTVSVTLTGTDRAGATVVGSPIAITVTNVNETPTAVNLSNNTIAEGTTAIGTLSTVDPDAGNTFTYTLGGADAAAFTITGDSLALNTAANFEVKSSYAITVTSTDQGGLATSAVPFTITVTDVNEAPTDITLTNNTINESIGSVTVGALSATGDPDAGASATFALVAGTGDTNNGLFSISGSNLVTAGAIAPGSYSVRVEATDNGAPPATFAKELAITVNDVADLDGDGINDSAEGADANNPAAASFPSIYTQALRLTTSAGTLSGVSVAVSPGSEPVGTTFPVGIVSFSINGLTNGQTVTVDLTYPTTTVNRAYKINGTTYTEIPGATVTNTSLSYSITDGGALDADGTANGTIVDPAAPAFFTTSVADWTLLND